MTKVKKLGLGVISGYDKWNLSVAARPHFPISSMGIHLPRYPPMYGNSLGYLSSLLSVPAPRAQPETTEPALIHPREQIIALTTLLIVARSSPSFVPHVPAMWRRRGDAGGGSSNGGGSLNGHVSRGLLLRNRVDDRGSRSGGKSAAIQHRRQGVVPSNALLLNGIVDIGHSNVRRSIAASVECDEV